MKKTSNAQRPTSNVEVEDRERPIIFSAPMVRAILEDRKTQTRRIVKVRHSGCGRTVHPAVQSVVHKGDGWWVFEASNRLKDQYVTTYPFDTIRCPYGVAGDRLWVRETWRQRVTPHENLIQFRADGAFKEVPDTVPESMRDETDDDPRWRPSIHMPRWANRIMLEITKVRVERLNSISEEDAWAEGCKRGIPTDNGGFFPAEELDDPRDPASAATGWDCARDWYADLWDSLHGIGAWEKTLGFG